MKGEEKSQKNERDQKQKRREEKRKKKRKEREIQNPMTRKNYEKELRIPRCVI